MLKEIDRILNISDKTEEVVERQIKISVTSCKDAEKILSIARTSIASVLLNKDKEYWQGIIPDKLYYTLQNISMKDIGMNDFLMTLSEWVQAIKEKSWYWISSSLNNKESFQIVLQHHFPRGNYTEVICLLFCLEISPEQIKVEDDVFGTYYMKDIPLLPS